MLGLFISLKDYITKDKLTYPAKGINCSTHFEAINLQTLIICDQINKTKKIKECPYCH